MALLDLGEAAAIDRLIAVLRLGITRDLREIRRAIVPPGPGAQGAANPVDPVDPTGAALRELVFDPIVALGTGRRFILAPDGELNRLPFEVLPDPDGGYLLDRYELSYLSSGRDLLRLASPPARGTKPFVVAAPAFSVTVARLARSEWELSSNERLRILTNSSMRGRVMSHYLHVVVGRL